MLKQKLSPVGEEEAMGPSPKKRYTVDMVSNQSAEASVMVSNQSVEASVKVKEEVDTFGQIAQAEMMEDGDSKPPQDYMQKWDQEEFKPVVGDDILPNPQDFLPDDFLDIKEEDEITITGASVTFDLPASSASAALLEASIYVAPPDPNVINYEIKCALMTEIRRYGRQYGRIFKLLEEVQGPLEVKIRFVKFAIKEAARFKRYHLIHYLEKMLDDLMLESTIKIDDF